jgi:hypothetical protein
MEVWSRRESKSWRGRRVERGVEARGGKEYKEKFREQEISELIWAIAH